ncbi:MAG: hypothetical protein EOP04_13095, partial [Proteobacteria bacterium]
MNKNHWFAETLRLHEGRLLRFARRMVPAVNADEIVQECFLKLWRADHKDLQNREGPWLFSVARNLCQDWLKGEGKRALHQI